MDKKKKIIIAVAAVVLIIAAGVAIYFAVGRDSNNYVDVPVTEVVTDENGESVTDAAGQPVTQAVTKPNGEPQTEKKAQNNHSSDNNSNSNSDNQNSNSGENGNNNSDNSGSSNNGGNSDNKPEEDKKPKNRKITITAILPQNYIATDIMEIWVNGEKDSEVSIADFDVKQNKIVVTTENSYKDDAVVEVVLQKYKTNAKGTVLNNHEEIRFDFPLNGVEGFTGEDD